MFGNGAGRGKTTTIQEASQLLMELSQAPVVFTEAEAGLVNQNIAESHREVQTIPSTGTRELDFAL